MRPARYLIYVDPRFCPRVVPWEKPRERASRCDTPTLCKRSARSCARRKLPSRSWECTLARCSYRSACSHHSMRV